MVPNCFILGDFNLDARMEYRDDYYCKTHLQNLLNVTLENNFEQIVNFDTWSRTISGAKKSSILDHVYSNNHAMFKYVTFQTPTFGDHVLVIVL